MNMQEVLHQTGEETAAELIARLLDETRDNEAMRRALRRFAQAGAQLLALHPTRPVHLLAAHMVNDELRVADFVEAERLAGGGG